MLSESQERMLIIAKREHAGDVRRLFERWELHCEEIGVVTADGRAVIRDASELAASVPLRLLTEPPEYVRDGIKPRWLDDLQSYDLAGLPDVASASDILLRLLATPEIASKRYVWRQYDHQVLTNTVVGPGSDAAVMRIKGTKRAIAIATDGDGRMCYLDPYVGGAMAVAEAARNVVCSGAQPVALTDCLNFGNPEKPEVYYQLEEAIRGMTAACRAFSTPVVSGNVSLYNENNGEAIFPTPVVGMLGIIDDVARVIPMAFQTKGDTVYLLGRSSIQGLADDLAGSEYLKEMHGLIAGRPQIDLDLEVRLQQLVLAAAEAGLLASAHDCSRGGLAVALAECAFPAGLGLDAASLQIEGRFDAALFGESPSRIVISTAQPAALEALAHDASVPFTYLGLVAADRLVLGSHIDLPIADLEREYEAGLARAISVA
jgi:phosphoribosylformylglycinamidine synthase